MAVTFVGGVAALAEVGADLDIGDHSQAAQQTIQGGIEVGKAIPHGVGSFFPSFVGTTRCALSDRIQPPSDDDSGAYGRDVGRTRLSNIGKK